MKNSTKKRSGRNQESRKLALRRGVIRQLTADKARWVVGGGLDVCSTNTCDCCTCGCAY